MRTVTHLQQHDPGFLPSFLSQFLPEILEGQKLQARAGEVARQQEPEATQAWPAGQGSGADRGLLQSALSSPGTY